MTINFASIFLPVLTAALSGVFLFILNKYIGRRVEARDLRLVAIRTWQDDLYTFADLLNHAGCHGQWPGPPDSFWSPSS